MHWIQRLAKQQQPRDLQRTFDAVTNVFSRAWQYTYPVLIVENIATRGDKRLRVLSSFSSSFFIPPPTFLSLLPSLSFFFFYPSSTLWWIVAFFPSSSYHPLWVGRIFHTAFGPRLVKHLGHRTKYRNSTWRQTQAPTAISSQAILIARVAVWVIPSVMHDEALSLFPAQWWVLAFLCMTLSWQSDKQTSNLCYGWLRRYWTRPRDSCAIFVKEFTQPCSRQGEKPGPCSPRF